MMDLHLIWYWFGSVASVGILILGAYILRYGQPKRIAIVVFFLGLFCFQYAFFGGIRDQLSVRLLAAVQSGALAPEQLVIYLSQIQIVALISLTGGPFLLVCLVHFSLRHLFPFSRWDQWIVGIGYGVATVLDAVFLIHFQPIGEVQFIRFNPVAQTVSIGSQTLIPVYLIACAVLSAVLIGVLVNKSIRAPSQHRIQFRLIAGFLSVTLLLVIIFSTVLPAFGFLSVASIGRSGFWFLFLGIFLAITQYRAFDIRTALHHTVYWVVVSVAAVSPVWIVLWGALHVFPILEGSIRAVSFFGVSCIALSLVGFQVVWVQPKINQWFFKRRYQLENEWVGFADQVAIQQSVDDMVALIETTLTRCLYPDFLAVVVGDGTPHSMPDGVVEIQMSVADSRVGTVWIGGKKNLKPYTPDERTFMRRVAHQSAIHLNHAILIDALTQTNTELISLQDTLLVSERERITLEQTQHHTQALARGIIHEVKNAHFAIRSFITVILEDRLAHPMDVKSVLSVIGEQSSKLFLFSTNYLHQELIKSQLYFIQPTRVVVSNLVTDAVQLNFFLIQTQSLNVVPDGLADHTIWVDRDKVLLVVSNLIHNAAQHVTFNTMVISVDADDHVTHLRFSSRLRGDKGAASPHGTGFGLQISRYIIECHGGEMTESEVGDRFVVDIRLPFPVKPAD